MRRYVRHWAYLTSLALRPPTFLSRTIRRPEGSCGASSLKGLPRCCRVTAQDMVRWVLYNPGLAETLGMARRAQANDLPPTVKLILLIGTYMNERYHGRTYAKAQNQRRVLKASYDRVLEEYDVIAMPTTPMKANRYEPDLGTAGIISKGWQMVTNTAPFDMSGHPAISIPCGKSNGLPVGLMLVGKHFDDATLFRAAHAFEQHTNWESLLKKQELEIQDANPVQLQDRLALPPSG